MQRQQLKANAEQPLSLLTTTSTLTWQERDSSCDKVENVYGRSFKGWTYVEMRKCGSTIVDVPSTPGT